MPPQNKKQNPVGVTSYPTFVSIRLRGARVRTFIGLGYLGTSILILTILHCLVALADILVRTSSLVNPVVVILCDTCRTYRRISRHRLPTTAADGASVRSTITLSFQF